jgi:hypothetical protein
MGVASACLTRISRKGFMKHFSLVALVIVLTTAACDNSSSTTAPTSPNTYTYTFAGTAPAAVNGVPQSDSKPFNVGQSGGTVSITLTSAVETLPGGVLNPSVVMGIGVGTPTGTSCTLSTGTAATLLSAGASSSISGTLSPGAYCIQVTNEDASAQTSGPVAYTVVVMAP